MALAIALSGQYITAVEFYGYFEREVFHFYGERLHRNALHDRNIARAFRVRLTMDNAINFTSRSTPLVMDLQYVANGARASREECDSLPSTGLIRDKIASQ